MKITLVGLLEVGKLFIFWFKRSEFHGCNGSLGGKAEHLELFLVFYNITAKTVRAASIL